MKRALATLLAVGMALVAGHAAAQDDARVQALAEYKHDLLSILVLRGDATHLLGAAQLARSLDNASDGFDYHALLHRAGQRDPDNAAIAWAALADCAADADACPNGAALARLRKLAPDNAAVWLLVLGKARRDGDTEAARQALTRAAAAGRYTEYRGPLIAALASAATALPVSDATLQAFAGEHNADNDSGPASVQAFIIYGETAALPSVNFLPLMHLCDPTLVGDVGDALATCRKLAATLRWGTSPRARAAGLHLEDVLAPDPATRSAAQRDMRNLAWQVRNYSRLVLHAYGKQSLAAQLLRLAQAGGSKMSRVAALLHHYDIPLEAPAQEAQDSAGTPAPASSSAPAAAATSRAAGSPDPSAAPASRAAMPAAALSPSATAAPTTASPDPASSASAPPPAAAATPAPASSITLLPDASQWPHDR